jgi:molybdopterin molybdotransferase
MTDQALASKLLQLADAIALIAQSVKPITAHENVKSENALNCITASDIHAPYALPPFDNTGVDGYAFRFDDLTAGQLKIIGSSFAGEGFKSTLPTGSTVHIATGAPLPVGADTVVMQEHCTFANDILTLTKSPSKGANIRHAGNDIAANALAVSAAEKLNAGNIAILGALGMTEVRVIRRLRIGIASTGNEIRAAGSKLEHGQIIDTNSLMLKQLLSQWNVDVSLLGALPDDRAATGAFLINAANMHDLVITTGGVSVGQRDFVRDALKALGTIHFWKIAIRPGRPVMFGQIKSCLMLGLPGNPVSAYVTFYLIALPILQALCGMRPSLPRSYTVTLGMNVTKEPNLRSFPRTEIRYQNGQAIAFPYRDQSSNLISSLVYADGLLDIPIGITEIKVGEPVQFIPLRGL